MKKILSLILTLLVSLTSLACLTYAEGTGTTSTYTENGYNVAVTLTNITVESGYPKIEGTSYIINLKPSYGYVMPDSIDVYADNVELDECRVYGDPSGCGYIYNRSKKDNVSTLMIYENCKNKTVTVNIEGVTWDIKFNILDGNTNVNKLFYNVTNTVDAIAKSWWDDDENYTDAFGINDIGEGYGNYGMYTLPDDVVIKIKDSDTPLTKCSKGADLSSGCDYTYDNDYKPYSYNMFGHNQKASLAINRKYLGKEITVTVNLNRTGRPVIGTIKNGYFNDDTTKTGTGEIELKDIYKADYLASENNKYKVKINNYADTELPESINVYVYPTTTHKWTLADAGEYDYDSTTGIVTFNSSIFDYNEKFWVDAAETIIEKEEEDTSNNVSIITCEDANGKGWVWSESKKACVYKVSNTSTK